MSYGPPPPQGPGGYGPPPPPPPGGGYGAPPPPPNMGPTEPPANKGAAIALTVLSFLFCCNLLGAGLGIAAIATAESNPKASRTCMLIGWIIFALGLVGSVIYWIVFLASGAGTATTY
ncbi:hypothetical protein O4J56_08290 [Nocardiopsis sp. RSe5-2]|uniref:DUF4190 domain-containing protein n=1 Tax=Nocardiopsis endophytica TaxID=3018445 RepID=A0ABT4U115_9ACTN|nr:hypothetical protein [Nocardiopsis endophytica]MDA2810630.1 hypothetical protein [Nocardiopsis endophytica]